MEVSVNIRGNSGNVWGNILNRFRNTVNEYRNTVNRGGNIYEQDIKYCNELEIQWMEGWHYEQM